jgi:hypothetical protein
MDAGSLPGSALNAGAGRRALRSPWLRAAGLLVALAAWGWFLRGQLAELQRYPWRLAPPPFGLGVLLGAAYFGGLGLNWALLLRTMGGRAADVPLAAGANVWLSTMLSRYIPGNVWHILGRLAMAGRLGVGPTQILASATVEQLLTLMGALAVFGLSLPLWRGAAPLWALLLVPAGLAALHPRILGAALGWAALRLRRPGLAWPYRYGQMLGLLLAFAGANLVAGLALGAIVGGLTPVGPADLPFLVGAAGLAWAIGYLSLLTPSGLGVREAALAALLAQTYPLPVAVVGSLAYRLALSLGEILAVGLSLLIMWLHRRAGEPRTEHTEGHQ